MPVRFSFLSKEHLDGYADTLFVTLNAFSDIFMACNVVLTFFRGFVHPTRGVITVFQEIRMHYVFGKFGVDLAACCPMDLWLPEMSAGAGLLARPKAAARLFRLLHLRHLSKGDSTAEASDGFFHAAANMIAIILTMVHFLACGWWMLGTRWGGFQDLVVYNETFPYDKEAISGDRSSWTYTYVHRPSEPPLGDSTGGTPFWWQYLVSFYWSSGRITGQSSPGNIFAATWWELGWICTMFLLNVAVNGYCDGILVDKVIAGDEAAIEGKAMRKIVDEYVQNADLPHALIAEVRASAEESGKLVERQRMDTTISALPHSLKQRVARRLFLHNFLQSEIFSHCSESFLVELGACCKIISFSKDTQLAHIGEPANQLMVLNNGRVGIISPMGVTMAETTAAGEMLGEMPFIFDLKHAVLITALEETRLTVLSRKDFQAACKLYPDAVMALRRGSMKAIQALSADTEEDDRDKGAKSRLSKSKSSVSFATSGSASSNGSSASSQKTSVSQTMRRMYASDLKILVEKMREEQAAARQDLICNFIQSAADGDLASVEATLIKGEVLVNEADYDARTALHLAVCNGHEVVTKALVEKYDASTHLKDRFGHTPLDDAVREQHPALVTYLKSRGSLYQVDGDVAAELCQAAFDNDITKMRLMLKEVGVNPNSGDYDKRTPLHLAASEGHIEAVELLIDLPDINLSPKDRLGNTPLDDAMRHKHVQVRRLLQQCGAKMGDSNLGVVLCEHGFRDNGDAIHELFDSQISLDVADYDNRTCLHLAASEGHLSTATFLLLEARVDPNPLDRFLNTPLDDANRHNHSALAAFLADFGGISGRDPRMVGAVDAFRVRRAAEQQQLAAEKLEKEVNTTEVCSITRQLEKLAEHPTLEDDILAFVSHARMSRSYLLKLVHRAVVPQEDSQHEPDEARGNAKLAEELACLTKGYRERLLEQSLIALEQCAARVVSTLEAELVPWLQGISRAEIRMLNLVMPGFREVPKRVINQLAMRIGPDHLGGLRGAVVDPLCVKCVLPRPRLACAVHVSRGHPRSSKLRASAHLQNARSMDCRTHPWPPPRRVAVGRKCVWPSGERGTGLPIDLALASRLGVGASSDQEEATFLCPPCAAQQQTSLFVRSWLHPPPSAEPLASRSLGAQHLVAHPYLPSIGPSRSRWR